MISQVSSLIAAHLDNAVREPGDEAELVQVGRHGDESGEPGKGVPRRAVGEAFLRYQTIV